jgi:hypothetical protein
MLWYPAIQPIQQTRSQGTWKDKLGVCLEGAGELLGWSLEKLDSQHPGHLRGVSDCLEETPASIRDFSMIAYLIVLLPFLGCGGAASDEMLDSR